MRDARSDEKCQIVLIDALKTIDILSDALDDIYAVAKSNPLDRGSVSIRQLARKAIDKALNQMGSK